MIKHNTWLLIIFIFSSHISYSQVLKGKITTQNGEPVQYATVYIQELKQGTTANTKGDYELKLPVGKYMVIYQSLGYEPVFYDITITDKTIIKNVILPVQYYEIPEVRISASGEDPAYIIMRKVIGMAPYYLNNVTYYKAEVYLKGNLVVNRIPKILQQSMKMEARRSSVRVSAGGKEQPEEEIIKEGDSYLMESFNEMEFTAPDRYIQRMISYNSTFPDQGNEISPMNFIEASFYQPVIAEMAISPLSPAAFSHYNFKYLGASLQGNNTINKIEVKPKRKSQQLFEGTIYIIEDLWCLHSVDLTNENIVGKVRIQQLYIPVHEDIWLPVSHKFDINISIVGFKADAGYGSSVKYLEVRPNLSLAKPKTITTDFTGKPLKTNTADTIPASKTKQQIETILEKDQINNRDMVKLSRLMEKESEKSIPDSSKNSLEIVDKTTHIIEKDANKKDSTYWAQIRPIPLSDLELRSLRVSDSIKSGTALKGMNIDSTSFVPVKKKSKLLITSRDIIMGHSWSDTLGFRFTNGGLIDPGNLKFNSVDGFVYGLDFSISKTWNKKKQFYLSPEIYWTFSRKELNWRVNTFFRINTQKLDQVFLRTGVTSTDINNIAGINTFINSITSLLLKENYLKLYESKYITFGYMKEIVNGLNLELSTNFEERRVLYNTTNFSFLKSSTPYHDNVPVNSYMEAGSNPVNSLRDMRHIDIAAKVTYTPFQRYRIRNGRKIASGSDWPSFILTYKHGINEFSEMTDKIKHTDMLRFETGKRHEMGAFSEFRWRVRSGGFFDNRELPFYDFFHINSQSLPVLINNYEDAFMLPAYYSLSTPELFGEVHVKYTTPYLLIKLLPVISNTLMRENLSFSYLGSRFNKNYTEFGYSISEILLLGEIGVYVGFEDLKYKSFGAKLVFKFN